MGVGIVVTSSVMVTHWPGMPDMWLDSHSRQNISHFHHTRDNIITIKLIYLSLQSDGNLKPLNDTTLTIK